jgi:hypothetical protein
MPNFQDIFKNDVARGAALGVGAALVAFAAIPAIVAATRPLVRVAVKSSLLLLEKGREVVAEAGEHMEDIVAEVKAELAAERDGPVEADLDDVQENSTAET